MIKRILNRVIFKLKHKTCRIESGSVISRKAVVAKGCYLGRNCIISTNVIMGNNVHIGEGVKLRNIRIGNNTMFESGVKIVGPGVGKISIGNECYIGVNNILDSSNDISIGDFVHIAGPSTGLWCHSSAQMCMNSIPLNDVNRYKHRPTAPIVIEDNVYIGGNCTIYPGVTIHHHSILTPNSAITKDVESYCMVGGVPAKVIKKINI